MADDVRGRKLGETITFNLGGAAPRRRLLRKRRTVSGLNNFRVGKKACGVNTLKRGLTKIKDIRWYVCSIPDERKGVTAVNTAYKGERPSDKTECRGE